MPDFGIFRGFNEKLFGDKLYAGQLPINLGLIGSGNFTGVDIDALAFFTRVTAAGGTLSATEQSAIDTLVKQMKDDGIWTKMKAIYPMVGASAGACAQNLKSASFTGVFNGGWTFASTGATPNGTSGYMNTNLNMLNDLSQNNVHFSVYLRTDSQGVLAAGGAGTGNDNSIMMYPRLAGGAYINLFSSGGNNAIAAASNSLRFRMLNRINSSVINYFENTTKFNGNLPSVVGSNKNIYISALNSSVNPLTPGSFDNRENAFVSLGEGFDDTQALNLYNSVQAFQTTLGRQV
jgi:hypothetical protein